MGSLIHRLVGAAIALSVLLGVASYGVYKTRRGDWWWLWAEVRITGIKHDTGQAYVALTGRPELGARERLSPAQISEDGRGLFPSNAPLAAIRQTGHGGFLFQDDSVYFSSSDGTDPRTNGRRYQYLYPPVRRETSRALYGTTLGVMFATLLLSVWALREEATRRSIASFARRLPHRAGQFVSAVQPQVHGMLRDRLGTRAVMFWLMALWIASLSLVVVSQSVFLMRTGQWTTYWQEQPLDQVRPEIGVAYLGHTGREDIGSQAFPSSAAMFEDGFPLGLRNAPHADIREVGRGRYSFWYDQVYFAASDNTDPRANGRRYTIAFSPVSRTMARVIYVVSGALFLLTGLFTLVAVRARVFGPLPEIFLRSHGTTLLGAASAASLVAIGILRSMPSLAPIVSALWTAVFALNLLTAWAYYAKYGPHVPKAVFGAFLISLGLGYYFLTVWAPHPSQGCHTTDPYPIWDAFCIAPDSTSYYHGYRPGSTRQPLYPWAIGALTRGTNFDPPSYTASVSYGKVITDQADPLFRVVRAQIVILLAGAVIACAALMRMLGSPLPAVAFLWLYDQQFLSANELNVVLTEALVQASLLLLVASFLAFMAEKRRVWLLAAAISCGMAYLTRQASAYSALMLGVLILVALVADWRRWWKPCAAAVAVFGALCAVPDVYTFVQTGSISKQQESLQYQYRIAHAMQYAQLEDVALMPDDESRAWLADAVRLRDIEHHAVDVKFGSDEYNRMVYYINANLYSVATPPGAEARSPQFFMKVATPILTEHWLEYARFSFRFWVVALERPGIARVGVFGLSPWLTYAALGCLVLALRDRRAIAGATFILCHWAAVALTCLFAAPIPRMVWASEFLVVLAAVILAWSAFERAFQSDGGAAWLFPAGARGKSTEAA